MPRKPRHRKNLSKIEEYGVHERNLGRVAVYLVVAAALQPDFSSPDIVSAVANNTVPLNLAVQASRVVGHLCRSRREAYKNLRLNLVVLASWLSNERHSKNLTFDERVYATRRFPEFLYELNAAYHSLTGEHLHPLVEFHVSKKYVMAPE